ncbi:MAG: alpha-glucosidase [Inquilinaceae bacterium]
MTQPWWRGAVIYQIYPRSFLDSDGNGVGDLRGIADRLDYVRSLGVDAIWISPFFKSPMRDFGYDVSDYRTVDPLFGTNEDFLRLMEAAHAMGLKVIVDMVLAHTSDEHHWFRDSRGSRDGPLADRYVWADAKPDGTPPNNWLSMFGGPAWQWDPRRGQYYLHHFLRSQPNLNWHDAATVDAMLGEVEYWLKQGVDGLRLDAITTLIHDPELRDNPPADGMAGDIGGGASNPFAFQRHLYDRDRPEIIGLFNRLRGLTDRYPDRFLMGEVADVDSIDATARYTSGSDRLHSAYTFQLTHADFDAPLLARVVGRTEREVADGWPTYAFTNHDCIRPVTRWGALPHLSGDRPALAKLLMACLLSLRGTLCVYQGEELGLAEADIPFDRLVDPWGIEFYPDFKGRDGCRTPLPWAGDRPHGGFTTGTPWLPVPDEHRALSVDRQEADADSVLAAYRRFLTWRKGRPSLMTGAKRPLETAAPIYAFEREGAGDRLLCAFNLSNVQATLAVGAGWRPTEGHGFAVTLTGETLSLPPFGAAFLDR